VTDRVLLLLKDGRLGASAIAETFRTFFDSLITRASLRLLPLLETLLFKRVDLVAGGCCRVWEPQLAPKRPLCSVRCVDWFSSLESAGGDRLHAHLPHRSRVTFVDVNHVARVLVGREIFAAADHVWTAPAVIKSG